MYSPTFPWSQTVRGGAHGLVYSKCVKANFNLCGFLIVASLSGSEFQSNMLLSRRIFVAVFVGVDGIVCFAIEMSSATQNWLKMTNG